MPRRWTQEEKQCRYQKLHHLYLQRNLTINEVGTLLGISEKTVFDQLKRLGIPTHPEVKKKYLNKRTDLIIPQHYSKELAEFFGIMLGDGHLTHNQIVVTLGNKELLYAEYIVLLIHKLFNSKPKIATRKKGYKDVYLGSVDLTRWLFDNGLVKNKVQSQVDAPQWIFKKNVFMKNFMRGFFDTDGSIYLLKCGLQIGLTNRSIPLLKSLQRMLICLEYSPSAISGYKVYITRRDEIKRFFREIRPKNPKHLARYTKFMKCVGTQAVNEGRL